MKEAFGTIVSSLPCKLARGILEKSDFVQNRAVDYVFLMNKSTLTEDERKEFKNARNKIKKGEPVSFSELGDILKRNRTEINGIDCLNGLENTAILVVANHPSDGPFGGWAQMLITSSVIKEKIKKEPLWVYGKDESTFQNVAREKIGQHSGSAILLRQNTTYGATRQVGEALLKKNVVGIHPEAGGSAKLNQAISESGNLMLQADRKGIPIICSSGFFDAKSGQLNISFFRISKERILEFADSRQKTADFVMAEIAKRLPPEKRGFYS